jgi:hypothetical protein
MKSGIGGSAFVRREGLRNSATVSPRLRICAGSPTAS